MQTLFRVLFASSNKNKYNEVNSILSKFGISVKFFKCNLQEIQAKTLEEVALHKAQNAFSQCSRPVIVEDDGFFINSLNDFPGPYSSFVFKTIGIEGILRLIKSERKATFQSVIAYCEKKQDVVLFNAVVRGKISRKPRGEKWGYDPIFIPEGQNKTYAQLCDKNLVSHRYLALKKFASWYLHKQKSSDR
ncbi:MAG: RdgB/HAM1 family non-canonical purine NTP pyrophosphatase [Nitrososphaerota archaeon]